MEFGFTEEQETFRKRVRRFIEEEVRPRTEEFMEAGGFPHDLWRQIGEFGLLGIALPEEYGGHPGDSIMRGIVAEELGRVDLSLAFTLISSYGTSLALLHSGSREQKETWIPGFIKGEKLGSIGMTEPDCGSDLSRIRTRATKEGDHYTINGEKSCVSWGLVADVTLLFAKTEKNASPGDLSCFLIPLNVPGIAKSPAPQMGLHTVEHGSLTMEDLQVPVEYRLGLEGRALSLAAKVFPHTRMILSCCALGSAQVSLEEAVAFAKDRISFDVPLAKFEGVAFKVAEDTTLLETAKCLCYRTLWQMDQGVRCVKEVAMCKWWSNEVAMRIIHNTLLLLGQTGYSSSYSLEQRFRDSIGYEIAEATPQMLKLTISEEIFGKELRPFC
jgi:cyclohexanecarboxyl-CoA dehydrogenase